MDSNKIKTVPAREAQDGWQKDQNGKSFIYLMCYFIFSRGGQQSVLPPRGVARGH